MNMRATIVAGVLVGLAATALGQVAEPARPSTDAPPASVPVRGSLFKQAAMTPVPVAPDGNPAVVSPVSFTAVAEPAKRKFQKNGLVTVIVREDSDASTSGKGNSKKQQDFDLALQEFIKFGTFGKGFLGIEGIQDTSTLPEIKFKYSNDRKNDASQERKDRFTARIQATIVDVKPNGTLVLEATKHIQMDKEEQHFTLTGIARAEDVTPDNAVLSTQLAELKLTKTTKGEVRDGTRRGWLNKFIDAVNPF